VSAPLRRGAPGREIAGEASDVKSVPARVGHPISPPNQKARATAKAGSSKGDFYRLLPTRFRHNGFDYRQIARKADAAIYEQRWTGCVEPSVCYEVIRIKRREGFEIGGRFVGPAEIYPNSEAWGTDGFTLTDRDAAFAKLSALA
jgi:hypothetical protein